MESALCSCFDAPLEWRDGNYVFAFDEPVVDAQERIDRLCALMEPAVTCSIRWARQNQQDWLSQYRQSVQPVRCGGFWVRPSWHEGAQDGLIDVVIDPGLVFGTGHHETTCGCLEALAGLELRNKRLIDVGCGSGILAIAAARRGALVSLCDTDKAAIIDSRHNCEINGVKPEELWVGSADQSERTYEIVVANIVADVLVFLRQDLERITQTGGYLILSGVLNRYKSRIEGAYKAFETIHVIERGEWLTFVLKKI
ncbi:MAG: 50S ribosomal protein L11 methyltransferase [Campylobacterales bacterium]